MDREGMGVCTYNGLIYASDAGWMAILQFMATAATRWNLYQ